MDEDSKNIGSPITLAELRALGEFVRWQELPARVAILGAAQRLPPAYPLMPSRLPRNELIDLCVNWRWQQVKFLREEGSAMGGDRRIVYGDAGAERSIPYDWYGIAPVGCFTDWNSPRPVSLAGTELLDTYELAQRDHVIQEQSVGKIDWPYLTINAKSFHATASTPHFWQGSYTVHAADPRVRVPGITAREPWFNTTITISHRWLRSDHPDPDRIQHAELLTLCEQMGLHETQSFLIDFCSLPQSPRTTQEHAWFRANLPGFQAQFKYVTLVLNAGSADYATRAWCMFELMLAAMSRTQRPTLLNHDRLDPPLRMARNLAQQYSDAANANKRAMLAAFGRGLTHGTYRKWSNDPANVGFYNAEIGGRDGILEKFREDLAVTDPNDRPIIVELLERLAFE